MDPDHQKSPGTGLFWLRPASSAPACRTGLPAGDRARQRRRGVRRRSIAGPLTERRVRFARCAPPRSVISISGH